MSRTGIIAVYVTVKVSSCCDTWCHTNQLTISCKQTHVVVYVFTCITCRQVSAFCIDANTCTFSVALGLQWVPLLLGGCETAECVHSGAVKCNGVDHGASCAFTVTIQILAVKF